MMRRRRKFEANDRCRAAEDIKVGYKGGLASALPVMNETTVGWVLRCDEQANDQQPGNEFRVTCTVVKTLKAFVVQCFVAKLA